MKLCLKTVLMVTFDWLEVVTRWRGEWKSVSTEHGVLYVTMDSVQKMLLSFAISWMSHMQVSCDKLSFVFQADLDHECLS